MSHISVYTHVFMVTESNYVINILFQAFLRPTLEQFVLRNGIFHLF